MSAPRAHPMMAVSNHDEQAEQMFVVALKGFVFGEIDPELRATLDEAVADLPAQAPRRDLRRKMEAEPVYQNWVSVQRAAQELMWQAAGDCVDRQEAELESLGAEAPQLGSVTTDPDFVVPEYLAAMDTHMMPGSYYTDPTGDDLRQGALFDKAASLYSLGRQGGQLNEMRGHTVVSHLFERFPDMEPERILEMGCTVGHSLGGVARYFPNAEIHGIDVGASLLRFAHARAAHMGSNIHFSQQNAECTNFQDNYFDMVFSSAMLHETSAKGVKNVMAECHRVLRPGGVMIHLEVPLRETDEDHFGWLRGDYESRFNLEPFWHGAVTADLEKLASDAGFNDVVVGYQDACDKTERGSTGHFGGENKGVYRSWYIVSGLK